MGKPMSGIADPGLKLEKDQPAWFAGTCFTDHGDEFFTCEALLDFQDSILNVVLVFRIIVSILQPSSEFHQRSRAQAVVSLRAFLEPSLLNHDFKHLLGLADSQALSGASLRFRSILRLACAASWCFVIIERLHRGDSHNLVAGGVVSFKHRIKKALQETDLICRMRGCELCDRVIGRVDKSIDPSAGGLVISATDFQVKRGNVPVGRCDVRVEVGLGDIIGKRFALLCLIVSERRVEDTVESKCFYHASSGWPQGSAWLHPR